MTTPFQDALLAIEIAVAALHGLRQESREANSTVEDAFAQIQHLGFSVEPVKPEPTRTFASRVSSPRKSERRLVQKTLF
jgi:hypothetical protein